MSRLKFIIGKYDIVSCKWFEKYKYSIGYIEYILRRPSSLKKFAEALVESYPLFRPRIDYQGLNRITQR